MTTNLVPCPLCTVNTIDKTRNKRNKYKQCADRDAQVNNKKQKQVNRLPFNDGCKTALHDSTNSSAIATSLLKCYPIKLKIKKYNKVHKDITTHALLHAQEVETISEELRYIRYL